MKTENTPSQSSIAAGETLELSTRFGGCSRGKCWGKFYPGKTRASGDFEWCEKSGGTVYLSGPGFYIVGSNDGFQRKAQAEFTLVSKASASAKKAHQRNEHTLEWLKEKRAKVAANLAEKGDQHVRIVDSVGTYREGDKCWRANYLGEIDRVIAEVEAHSPAPAPASKTKEQEKAEEAMLG